MVRGIIRKMRLLARLQVEQSEKLRHQQTLLESLFERLDKLLEHVELLYKFVTRPNPPTRSKVWMEPGHFYSPIVDVVEVAQHVDRLYDPTQRAEAIDYRDNAQCALLKDLAPLITTLDLPTHPKPGWRYYTQNPAYALGDASIYAGLLRFLRPQRLIEFGSGFSSCLALDINARYLNGQMACHFIDPYPQLLESLLIENDLQTITINRSKAQDTPPASVDMLQAGDILFIDSTHVCKTGSDVNFHLFSLLPRLQAGVYIHFHDVFHPFEYPKSWVFGENRSWNELYLLRSFLMHNSAYEIIFFNDYMAQCHKELLASLLPMDKFGNLGGGLWLRKCKM
jgi:Methyltransferase domain